MCHSKLKTTGSRTQRDFFATARVAAARRHVHVREATAGASDPDTPGSRARSADEVPNRLPEAPDLACGSARRLSCGTALLSHEQSRHGGEPSPREIINVPLADIVAVEPLLARFVTPVVTVARASLPPCVSLAPSVIATPPGPTHLHVHVPAPHALCDAPRRGGNRHKDGAEALGSVPQRWVGIMFSREEDGERKFYQIYLRMLDERAIGASTRFLRDGRHCRRPLWDVRGANDADPCRCFGWCLWLHRR